MTRANRWFLYGPFALAGVVLLGWFMMWRSGADAMRRGLAEFSSQAALQGAVIAHQPLKARGFPFFLRGAVADFTATTKDRHYACGRLYLDALPYAPDRLVLSCGGEQLVASRDRTWRLDAEDARASVARDKERGWMIRVETGALSATSGSERILVGAATVNIAPSAVDPATLQASLRILAVEAIGLFAVERLDAAASLGPADSAGERRLDIRGAELVVNGATLKAQGILMFAPGAAARGRLDAELQKPVGLARALASVRLLNADEAKAAEAGLAMLAVASGGIIRAPIEWDKGEVRLAGVRIARAPKSG